MLRFHRTVAPHPASGLLTRTFGAQTPSPSGKSFPAPRAGAVTAISDWAGGQELEHRQVRSPVESRVPGRLWIATIWSKQVGFNKAEDAETQGSSGQVGIRVTDSGTPSPHSVLPPARSKRSRSHRRSSGRGARGRPPTSRLRRSPSSLPASCSGSPTGW